MPKVLEVVHFRSTSFFWSPPENQKNLALNYENQQPPHPLCRN